MQVVGYGSFPDMTIVDMPQLLMGGHASLSYGYDPPQYGYG